MIANQNVKIRKFKDVSKDAFAYIFSSFGVLILGFIIFFVFSKGWHMLSFGFITSDYNVTATTISYEDSIEKGKYADPNVDGVYFSSTWGIGLEDGYNNNKEEMVFIAYIDNDSPFNKMNNVADNTKYSVTLGSSLSAGALISGDEIVVISTKEGAMSMAKKLDNSTSIRSIVVTTTGGGIRGSLISTLILVGMTLLFAIPLGIGASIYLSLLVRNKRIKGVLLGLIDLAGGIPTIIYGLAGAIIFIPLLNGMKLTNGGSLLSGALTMAILLLPTIIKTTIEAIKTVPTSYESASLALGANKTQTIFKVILPNALPGILTAILLAIGRIIGESAALIYAIGTGIKDKIILTESSATLAIHIWSLCAGENPNYDAACGVAIIILIIDLILNIIVKLISHRFLKKFKR